MAQIDAHLSTGIPGLDRVLKGLIPGDNLVWQVESVEDYRPFVQPFRQSAEAIGVPCVYFRFAKHPPLIPEGGEVEVHTLHPEEGFEAFLYSIHQVIERTGPGAFFVFDCLSDLAADWYSDQMLANFFMLTCPYLYDMHDLAYFAILRHAHAFHTTTAIADTTQVLLDVYRHKDRVYVHPWKVQARYSPTMHTLHVWEGDDFRTITESATIAEILTPMPWLRKEDGAYPTGIWSRTFLQADSLLREIEGGESTPREVEEILHRLLRMAISRDPRMLRLTEKHFELRDLLAIGRRMIGTGLIGGKSVGMLLSRAILRGRDPRWSQRLESHDSFYIGSDVFYTYLVHNGLWWSRERQKDPKGFLEGTEQARQRMLTGQFPEHIHRQFEDMLDYYGQSPIIVRSSSLLEDNFGNAFAGKYESVFCANQGPRRKRLDDFLSAVRTIYASCMSREALTYRAQRGLLDRDEQMALLVQRVSGAMYGESLYYPQLAGVGFSFNPYVWSEQIDPRAGVLRLVFGLGTRAVDRNDDDYTRLVALNAPGRRPETDEKSIRQYSQRKVDILDLQANQLVSRSFTSVIDVSPSLPLDLFASRDPAAEQRAAQRGIANARSWTLTFERLLRDTEFVADMREILKELAVAYDYPVDVEFTANFADGEDYTINIVQCRPLQIKEGGAIPDPPAGLSEEDTMFEAHGAVLGRSRVSAIDRIIYVVPSAYCRLPIGDRHSVARLLGRLMRGAAGDGDKTVMLLGPGRWGTTTPSLGIPVQFVDINAVSVMGEIAAMGDLVPDASLRTHFFSDLVELDILYFALFPTRDGNALNEDLLTGAPSRLTKLWPDEERWDGVVRVIDADALPAAKALRINANVLTQRVVCYVERA